MKERPGAMKKRRDIFVFLTILCLVFWTGLAVSQQAGPQRHRGRGEGCSQPLPNPTYKTTCGECHLTYPPNFLPSGSWKKILNQPKDHFGETLSLDAKTKTEITRYLMANGAERSFCKKSVKIMRSLNGKTPLRITEVPYIQGKHRGISPEVLKQKSDGSLSNCLGCHQKADQGIFRKG
jgi:hypothetical protein